MRIMSIKTNHHSKYNSESSIPKFKSKILEEEEDRQLLVEQGVLRVTILITVEA